MENITVTITFEEYNELMNAILWKQTEVDQWIARCKEQKTEREKAIYEASSKTDEILRSAAVKLRTAYYDA